MPHDRRGAVWRFLHSSRKFKIGLYFLLFASQIIACTIVFHYAYPILEGKPLSWPASLLFVLETVTTVGYGDLLPFTNDITILITIIIMATGVILIFMVIPLFLVPYLGLLFQAAPPRKIPHEISGHVVIIGYGELTRALVESLLISDLTLVLVEEKRSLADEANRRYGGRAYVVWGDYANPGTWASAWVKTAGYVVVNEEERTTARIILGIREMTRARIIAVVDKLSFDRYLRYAGAEYVLSPKHVTGQILARHAALTSHVDTLIEEAVSVQSAPEQEAAPGTKIRIINLPILPGSLAAGKTLGELDLFPRYGVDTLLVSSGGHFVLSPGPDVELDTTTMLFLVAPLGVVPELVEREFIPRGDKGALALIAGFGDVGSAAYQELNTLGISCVVIDRKAYQSGGVVGNAEDEAALQEAHIEEADFCIVALNDDGVNIFTTLMARNLNPRIRILARANDPVSVEKLYRAGADYVALLPSIGGQVIGGVVLADIVQVILNLPNGQVVVRKRVMEGRPGTVGRLEHASGVRILGIEGQSRAVVRPGPDEPLATGDSVLAVGYPGALKKLIPLL
jgi:Trk K+ transport system NAD-binding subunit